MKYKKQRKAEGKYVEGDPDEILITYPGMDDLEQSPAQQERLATNTRLTT